jgi:site-specific DNA-methyltransferase (adenine-specific)
MIIQGDCLEIMKGMPDKSIDLVLTDPPYGIGACKGVGGFGVSKTDRHYVGGWDKKRPSKGVFDEIIRVSKNAIIFGGNFFADLLPQGSHWLVWDKKGDIKFQNPYSDCELLWTNIKKNTVKKIVFKQQGFITDSKDKRVHPTQKPSELIHQILSMYGGNTILDPFMGSGTTGVACKELNRNFIGIEISPEYFKIAEQRIYNTQGSLL